MNYDVSALNPAIAQLPAHEEHVGMLTYGQLILLHKHAQDFGAASGLIDYCQNFFVPETLRHLWSELAARDAVMTIYHFAVTLRSIRSGSSKLTSLRDKIIFSDLRAATADFDAFFPSSVAMRHGVGHRADNIANLNEIKSHQSDTGLVFGAYRDRGYTVTYKGIDHTLLVNTRNFRALIEIVLKVFGAFPHLAGILPRPVVPKDSRMHGVTFTI